MKAYYHHQHHHSNKNAAVAVVTLVWLLLLGFVAGFGIAPLSSRTPLAAATRVATRATALQATTTPSDEEDVSIPYDSAARLAYDEWRAQFNKGPFDPKRYPNFQQNYETITVANVMAKKRAREEGTVSGIAANDYENVDENVLELLALNEYGDFSEDEYAQMAAASNPGLIPTTTTAAASTMTQPSSMSTGDVLTQAMEAAEMLSEASSALGEAADALAEEEEVRRIFSYILLVFCLLYEPIPISPYQ